MSKEIIWKPTKDLIDNSKLSKFIKFCDLKNKKSLTKVKGTLISNGKKAGAIETSGSNLDIKDIKISLKSEKGKRKNK